LTTTYSHSRLSSFENCAKKFQYRYVLKIPAQSEGIEAFVGKRVHEILERLYVFADQGMVPGIEKVVRRYHALYDEHVHPALRIVKPDMTADDYRMNGERCLRNFYHQNYPFDGDETLALEERVVFDLDDAGEYKMQGIIDRLVRKRDGTIEIQDYKTGRWVPSQKQLDEDRQLALYQIGVSERYGHHEPIRLVWHYVLSGKVRTSTRTPEQLQDLRRDTIQVIDRITSETQYKPKKNSLCNWCEYKSICPLFTGGDDAEQRAIELVASQKAAKQALRRPVQEAPEQQLSLL
jgi:putative RecB family exonuclease